MNERERILELVKQGVLSTEEGLDLLENLAKKEAKQQEVKEFDGADKSTESSIFDEEQLEKDLSENFEDLDEEIERISEEVEQTEDETVQSELEKELESLANEVNQYSVQLDRINDELAEAKVELREREEELRSVKEDFESEKEEELADLKLDLNGLEQELELVQKVDEVDNENEVEQLKAEINELEEQLRVAEQSENIEVLAEIDQLEKEVAELQNIVQKHQEEKAEIMRKLHSSKMKHWTTRAKKVSEKLEIPEDWKEEASVAFNKASETIGTSGKGLGDFIRQTVNAATSALDNVEWSDMNIRVPKLASTELNHEWLFENSTATILDFKNANGDIKFEPSMNDNIKVSAKIKLYGKMEEETPMEAFEARSIIEEDEDKITFHIPNKRIAADMIVYLPERTYDYMAVKLLNGDVTFDTFNAKDVYVKSTNGDITFHSLQATMLEVKGTNGDIKVKNAELRDLLVSTVNGDIRFKGMVQSSDVTTTNGDIRLTLTGEDLVRVKATSVNGDVKLAIPEHVDVRGEAKTVFGNVKSRLKEAESTEEKGKNKHKLTILRERQGHALQLLAKTTTGDVLLKDTDK